MLVFPCWWGTMPMPVFTFLEQYDFQGKIIYPICMNEGSGLGKSVRDIKLLCKKAIVHDGLAIFGSQINSLDFRKIQEWLDL